MERIVSTLSVAGIALLVLIGVYVLKKCEIRTSKFTKAAALILFSVMFIRYLYIETAIYEVVSFNMFTQNSPFNHTTAEGILDAVLANLLIWFGYAAMLAVVMSEFFEFKLLRNLALYFSVPVFIVILVFFDTYALGILGDVGYTFAAPDEGRPVLEYALGESGYVLGNLRLWMLVIECALGIALPLSHVVTEKRLSSMKGRRNVLYFIAGVFITLLIIMPSNIPQFFYRGAGINLKEFTELHRYMLYASVIIPILIFQAFKDKSEEVKRCAMIYLCLGTMWSYVGFWNFQDLADPVLWPIHLCNTAMFLIPLCLIFRMNRLFYFTLFINVPGAFLAMLMPNFSTDMLVGLHSGAISFWTNHWIAFFLPILIVALKLFERPKLKQWIYSLSALSVYFVLMLVINAWFSNYGECDYFFLNSDFIVSKLGKWAEHTRDFIVSFEVNDLIFTFYPLYQALFFIVYVAFTVGVWFLYALLFSTWDAAEDRRQRERDYRRMKKELNEYLGGRSIHEPASGDASPRLTLKHFSKRYGANKHYSVNDVSFDVKGGEIFGFLGPNGAGKSTIIKSVVGIQTITSGNIEICGFDVDKQPVQAKLHTGFVPDHYALYENLTGREYINYIADLYQVNAEYRNMIIEKLVTRFQLTGSFDNQMKTYSHGMKQKITIMAALVHNPAVWILDEPLTGLDPTSIHEVKECMKEHAAAGNIVFFSSHIIDVVEKICDRIAIIKKGKLRACTTIKELDEKGISLERFYLDIIENSDDEHVPYVEEKIGEACEA